MGSTTVRGIGLRFRGRDPRHTESVCSVMANCQSPTCGRHATTVTAALIVFIDIIDVNYSDAEFTMLKTIADLYRE